MSSDPETTKSSRFARYKDLREFVFAAVLTAYGILGYYVIRDQLSVMQRQTDLMQTQLIDAQRATRRDQRAWVFVTNAETTPRGVRIHVRNMGRTPAVAVTMFGRIGHTDSTLPPYLDPLTGAIPPGESQPFYLPVIGPWADGSGVHGEVLYRDVFGGQHFTRICYGVIVVKARPVLTRCSANNTTDMDGKRMPTQTIIANDPPPQ